MFDADHALQLVTAGVILLVGVGSSVAWLPATRRDPSGLPARVFMTAGLAMAVVDVGGVGSVLGLSLAAMGALVAWEGQPAPETPRPRRRGLITAAVFTGLAALATFDGWGPLERVPEELRAIAAVFVATTGVLATLAIADRARVQLRVALRLRFNTPPSSTS